MRLTVSLMEDPPEMVYELIDETTTTWREGLDTSQTYL
jgi:hypothetical protein